MRRKMDLIRAILEKIEARTEREAIALSVDGYDDLVVGQHIELLFDNGYLVGIPAPNQGSSYKPVFVRDLSWEGHEFLAVLRSDHGWAALRKAIPSSVIASLPLKVLQEIATAALKHWAMQQLGLGSGS